MERMRDDAFAVGVRVPTVEACYRTWWLPYAEKRLAPSSLTQYRAVWRRHIGPRWGAMAVDDLRPIEMQAWLLTLSRGAAEQSCKVLGKLLDYPLMLELIDRNPMRVPYRMPERSRVHDAGVYTYAELLECWGLVQGSRVELPFLLAAFGSARVGESLGVRADREGEVVRVRASNGVPVACVSIERQVDRNGHVHDRLKTPCSRRTVVLPGPTGERVFELVEDARARGGIWAAGGGRPMSQQVLNRLWREALEGSEMACRPFRNLRASWRTFMAWEMGVAEEKLEKMMGHAGDGVTARHYNRPDARMFAEAVAEAYVRYEGRS